VSTITNKKFLKALYSTVVSTVPVATAIPTLGPFSVNGYTNCFYNGNGGLTCNPNAKCQVCDGLINCGPSSEECDVFGVPLDGAGYITDMICTW
jgi:hypothetical protein